MHSFRLPSLALLLALLAAALTGCADREKQDACRGAEATLTAYMTALRNGDCEAAYACLSWKRRKEIPLERIKADYAAHRESYYHRANARLDGMHYDGFRVAARVINGEGKSEWISLIPEDGQWRIESTGANLADLIQRVGDR